MKKILLKTRVIILIIALLFSLIAIHPAPLNKGVAINGVVKDSPAYYAGIQNPDPSLQPVQKEVIKEILYNFTTYKIENIDDYNNAILKIKKGDSFVLTTNKNTYGINLTYFDKEKYEEEYNSLLQKINETINETNNNESTTNITNNINNKINVTQLKQKYTRIFSPQEIGLYVSNAPKSNLRLGLDLAGGTRVLLKIDTNSTNNTISKELYDRTIDSIKQRLNAFGLSEVIVRPSSDLLGNQYILVELSNINSQEIKDLLSKQGKFEAKIKNNVVFEGGKDITYVCRSATCSGLDPFRGCQETAEGTICFFSFEISLSPEAAKRQAEYTKDLAVIPSGSESFLSENLTLYLDGEKVDELRIGAGLKGAAVTNIRISGSGSGLTVQEAQQIALEEMKKLQTILETGKLPVKLKIVQIDNISPTLGAEFLKNALLVGLIALIAVIIILTFAYKKAVLSIPIIITGLSEVFIILGIAALIRWNLDLVSIAGIIVAIGTGVDDQIVITDETLNKENTKRKLTWKEKIKNAFFIILGAYFTTLVAMLPLMSAGAGMLKGFALTTIIGISIGVFITRPAFADILSELIKEKKEE